MSTTRPTSRHRVRTIGAAVASLAALAAVSAPAARADTVPHYGCNAGWACLYGQDATMAANTIIGSYYYYGAHSLSNVVGNHFLQNNQTGGAWVAVCYTYGGTDCAHEIQSVNGYVAAMYGNFTPINSIRLSATPIPTRDGS